MTPCRHLFRLLLALAAGLAIAGSAPRSSFGTEPLKLERGSLRLEFDPAVHTYHLLDGRTGRDWSGAPPAGYLETLSARLAGPHALEVSFKLCAGGAVFKSRASLADDETLRFEIEAADPQARFAGLDYPPRLATNLQQGRLVFCNRSQGNIIALDDPAWPDARLTVYANTSALDMPWIGLLSESAGDGALILFETPWEAAVNLQPDAAKNRWPAVSWFDSFHTFAYPRRVAYRFSPKGGYIGLTALYRHWAEQQGLILTLSEKARRNPRVEWLRGAMIVWGSDGLEFSRAARAAGVRRALLTGRFPRPDMEAIERMGMLVGEYDNYSDIVDGPLGFTRDNIEKVAYRMEDGSPRAGWVTATGTQHSMRAASRAVEAASALIPSLLRQYPYTSRFLDVQPCFDLLEDYNPARRTSRHQDLEYRIDLFKYVASLGLVLGGEHGKAWSAPYLDYVEGMNSGPYWWETPQIGQLIPLSERKQLSANYMRYGINPAARIPLWELAYHDALVTTWYWGDSNGYFYNIAPELSDRKDLFNMLYGTVPLVWTNQLGYGWARNRDRLLQTYYTTARLAERTGFQKMLSHEFLSEDRLVQRTRFESGVSVTVNFADEPRAYSAPGGTHLTLAPRGWHVEAKDLQHTRQWIDGAPLAWSHIGDFWYLDAPTTRSAERGPLRAAGRIVAFAAENGAWHVRTDHVRQAGVNPRQLLGLKPGQPWRFVELDEQGRMLRERPCDPAQDWLDLPAAVEARLYGFYPGLAPELPLIMPSGDTVSDQERITLACARPGLECYYTLDGSEPTTRSLRYQGPFPLERGAVIKARALKDGRPVSATNEAALAVRRELGRSGVKRGREEAAHFDVSVAGLDQLEIRITNGGDNQDYDQAGLGEPRLVAGGKATGLETLKPLVAAQDSGELMANGYEGDPLEIAGRTYKQGLGVQASARLIYALERKYQRFTMWGGVLDRAQSRKQPQVKRGSVEFILYGLSLPPAR